MTPRPLGETGLRVSPIALGAVKLGRTAGLKHPEPFDLPSDDEAADLLAFARDLGVNLIDTAPAYGTSEERLGRLLAPHREHFLISTKAGEEFDGAGSTFDFSEEAVTRSVERSLRRLGTEYLDVVLLHSDGDDAAVLSSGGADALFTLKRQGKIRAVGASTKTVEGALAAVQTLDVAMLTLNPAHTDELPAIQLAHQVGSGVLIKKALLSGHVAASEPAANGRPSAEACLRLALSTAGVSSVVVGTIRREHLEQAVAVANELEEPDG